MCATFNIRENSEYYFWIPTGIQSVIEKYGGKPVSLLPLEMPFPMISFFGEVKTFRLHVVMQQYSLETSCLLVVSLVYCLQCVCMQN